jgi:hypothetical protein
MRVCSKQIERDTYDTVIMVKATPDGELDKRYPQVIEKHPGPIKIKIMEQGGRTI